MSGRITQKNITADNVAGRDVNNITNLIQITPSPEELQTALTREEFHNKTLTQISDRIKVLDEEILSTVRSKSISSITQLFEEYNKRIKLSGQKHGLDIVRAFDLINDHAIKPMISEEADIHVEITKDLDKLSFKPFDGNVPIVLDEPSLLWECSCEHVGSSQKNCRIHRRFGTKSEAKNFTKLFRERLVKIDFDGVSIFWRDLKDLWPPSIDSLHFANDLRKIGPGLSEVRNVIDIGSGTGFLGIWFAKQNCQVKNLYFSDWLLLPLIFTHANAVNNDLSCSLNFLLGPNTSWFKPDNSLENFDLIICNPPYLPDLGFQNLKKESTVSGTDLLEAIIRVGKKKSKKVIISFSDIAFPEAAKIARMEGIDLEKCKINETPHQVPFRVPIAFNEPGYIKKLIKEKRLEERGNSEFKYWHNIHTYLIE